MGQSKAPAAVYQDGLLSHNLLVAGGTIGAGILGFAFQSMISHRLARPDYGAVFAVMSLLTLVTLPAAALTLLMARESSRDRALGHVAASAALLRSGNQALIICGVALSTLVAVASPFLALFFNVPIQYMLAVAMSMPFGLALPLLIGELQGEQRFAAFVLLTAGQAALKLVAAIVLSISLGPVGVVLGLAAATAISYGVALGLLRLKPAIRVNTPWLRPALRYLAVVLPSTVALSVLLSADVLLVKHFFSTSDAGEYAAVAALGRGIFYGAAGIAAVLFPKVIFHETLGRGGSRLVLSSIMLVLAGGVVGLVLLLVASQPVLTVFAGSDYAGGAAYLAWYAAAMILLGCAAVLIATHQSRARGGFLAVLVPITLLEPGLILAFHQTLMQVVQIVNVSMAALVIALGVPLVSRSRSVAGTPVIVERQTAEMRS